MRRSTVMKSLALAGLGIFLAGAPADAQLRPWEISIAGGPTLATGSFADEANTGYHVQGSVGIGVPLFPVGVRADLLWQELPDAAGGNFRHVGGIANATLGLPLVVIEPYVLAGVGLFSITEPEEDHGDHAHEGGSETSTGFNVGAGLELGLLGLKGFGEVRYLDVGHGHRTIPITIGIRF